EIPERGAPAEDHVELEPPLGVRLASDRLGVQLGGVGAENVGGWGRALPPDHGCPRDGLTVRADHPAGHGAGFSGPDSIGGNRGLWLAAFRLRSLLFRRARLGP